MLDDSLNTCSKNSFTHVSFFLHLNFIKNDLVRKNAATGDICSGVGYLKMYIVTIVCSIADFILLFFFSKAK